MSIATSMMAATWEKHNVESIEHLFVLRHLPDMGMPVRFAIALPAQRLQALPNFPRAALPESGRIASGRGLTAADCKASAIGEVAELASCCAWGDENLVKATEAELGPAAVSPEALTGWSQSQIQDRENWNKKYVDYDWRPAPHNSRLSIDWITVEDAYGGPTAYVPADFAYIGRRQAGDPRAVAIGDSNGCAAGANAGAARRTAVLELVERDATGRWWYGRRRRAPIDLASVEDDTGLVAWLCARERRSWLIDITSDISIPVIAAISAEPNGRDVVLGFAAHPDCRTAATSAMSEMLQIEISLVAARVMGDAEAQWWSWRSAVSMALPPLDAALALPAARLQPISAAVVVDDYEAILSACAQAGVALYFVNMTRPQVGLPVVRAISTSLCHFKPRFARNRLLAPDPRDIGTDREVPDTQAPLLI
jgi:ribosomal protein S12 methylthiotransferase accessory factor